MREMLVNIPYKEHVTYVTPWKLPSYLRIIDRNWSSVAPQFWAISSPRGASEGIPGGEGIGRNGIKIGMILWEPYVIIRYGWAVSKPSRDFRGGLFLKKVFTTKKCVEKSRLRFDPWNEKPDVSIILNRNTPWTVKTPYAVQLNTFPLRVPKVCPLWSMQHGLRSSAESCDIGRAMELVNHEFLWNSPLGAPG